MDAKRVSRQRREGDWNGRKAKTGRDKRDAAKLDGVPETGASGRSSDCRRGDDKPC